MWLQTGIGIVGTAILLLGSVAQATVYHVSSTGNDSASGLSSSLSFRHIQKGASIAMPGDTIVVHEGVYRERVKPMRGGTGENARITFTSAPGEKVTITGLDVWSPTWNKDSSLYYAIPSANMFTDSNYCDVAKGNPYRIANPNIQGLSLGHVVVDGAQYVEQTTKALALAAPRRWWCDVATSTIYINFGGDPTGKMVEITTRRGVFRPYLQGLGYITVQGFILEYCANQSYGNFMSSGLNPYHQSGLIGTRAGHHWIIKLHH
jgi:hypothetical protein